MITEETLVEYFNNYFAQYPPYEDKSYYQAIIKYLVKYYYNKLYNQIPEELKSITEDNIIPTSMYDTYLQQVGFEKKLLEKLDYSSKIVLFHSFTDFVKIKGSVKSITSLPGIFNESINIYELYIDYDQSLSKWILRPYPIHKEFTEENDPRILIMFQHTKK